MRTYQGIFLMLLFFLTILGVPIAASAQFQIQLPDCNLPENHDHNFCTGQCEFVEPLPSWCPQGNEPIVLVPGILASYNKKLLFKDESGGAWRFVPFGDIYKGLIKKFEKAGYVRGQDLFIAFYDWRQSNAESATEYLKPTIDLAKQASGSSTVNIVAHSMGGLVARSYIQGDNYEHDVDQLVMLGTPNQGASDGYIAWEGGILPDRWGIGPSTLIKIVENSLTKVREQELKRPESFRAFFPSLKELIPIASFAKKDNQVVPNNQLTEQNSFLQDLQDSQDLLADRGVTVTTIGGDNKDTLGSIALTTQRTTEDTNLQRWRDGHPQPDPPTTDSTAGDETVLLTSALFGDDQYTLANTKHTKLPEAAQDQVLATLGIEEPAPHTFFTFPEPKKILSFVVMSPLDITVTGPGGKTISKTSNTFSVDEAEYDDDPTDPDDPKVVTLADPPVGEYQVNTVGTGSGEYTVITTYADEQEVKTSERTGTTQVGKAESTTLLLTTDSVQLPPVDLRGLIKNIQIEIKAVPTPKKISKLIANALIAVLEQADKSLEKYQSFCDKKSCSSKQAQNFYSKAKDDIRLFNVALDKIKQSPDVSSDIKVMITRWQSDLQETGL